GVTESATAIPRPPTMRARNVKCPNMIYISACRKSAGERCAETSCTGATSDPKLRYGCNHPLGHIDAAALPSEPGPRKSRTTCRACGGYRGRRAARTSDLTKAHPSTVLLLPQRCRPESKPDRNLASMKEPLPHS